MENVVEVSGLCKTFDCIQAIRSADLKVARGSAFALVGPNGAGKTTMVRILSGILSPTAGTVRVLGRDVTREGGYVRSRCGFQTESGLYERLPAKDNLTLWGRLYGMSEEDIRRRTQEVLELFDLADRSKDPAGSFSKGMKQKLSIARALMHEPDVLFLDEPTAGLDPEASWELLSYLRKYLDNGQRTIFLCSHRLEEVESLCDHVAILDRGKVLASGALDELSQSIWPKPVFLIELKEAHKRYASDLLRTGLISDAAVSGGCLRVILNRRDDISDVISFLSSEKAKILSVSDEKHSLKDIYFNYMPKNGSPKD